MDKLNLPTGLHREAIEVITHFFAKQHQVDTILLTNSCARGKAIPESDLDLAVLVKQATQPKEIKSLENRWHTLLNTEPTLAKYKSSHRFAQIHLDIINGVYKPAKWDDGGGPDFFEIEIGNHLVYASPVTVNGDYFNQLREKWLPYYGATLQSERLIMVKNGCLYDLDQVPFFVKRDLYFYAFDKLYKAFQEFLQALFIRHGIYPIAYNKWIKEQFHEIIMLPELYKELSAILSVNNIESDELNDKAKILYKIVEQYC